MYLNDTVIFFNFQYVLSSSYLFNEVFYGYLRKIMYYKIIEFICNHYTACKYLEYCAELCEVSVTNNVTELPYCELQM